MKRTGALDNTINLAIGIIEDLKTNKNGAVRYKIAYKTTCGKETRFWSNWMRNDGYQIGDSIPLKALSLPGMNGAISVPIEINRSPQTRIEPYIASLVLAATCGLLFGVMIGRKQ